jgi:hypothetical protein
MIRFGWIDFEVMVKEGSATGIFCGGDKKGEFIVSESPFKFIFF